MHRDHGWQIAAVAAALVVAVACADEGREPAAGPVGTAGQINTAPGYDHTSYYDGSVHDFLPDYIGENPLFADDDLEFWVKDGRVGARGAVDSQAERDELERRLRRVPSVRDVDMSGVTFGS